MTNQISIYNFNQNPVRTQTINGEPWFCLSDACTALNLKQARSDRLPVKGVTKSHTLTNGGKQELTFINEPNLYRLIFRSNKPQAQAFADWVYNEVLPSIRKTGAYGVPSLDVKALAVAVAAEMRANNLLPSPKPKQPEFIRGFIDDQVMRMDVVTPFADIYQMFNLWCLSHDKPTPSAIRLSLFLQANGFEKTTDRKGNKAFRLGLKQYDNSRFRYAFEPVRKFSGSGIYKVRGGECYQAISSVSKSDVLYTWFNLRTGQAEGPAASTTMSNFESLLEAKMTAVVEVFSKDGSPRFVGLAA